MESSLDYIATDEESSIRENETTSLSDHDAVAIQDFIQNGPVPSYENAEKVDSLEISASVVNPGGSKITMSDFKVLNVIGRGGYGKVFLVQKSSPGVDQHKLYAMKVLKKAKIIRNEKDTAHTKSERNILEMIRHPFLVKLHYAFQNHSNLYIVLTFCSGGELFTYLEREGTLMENQACFYIAEISLAIGHLHSLGIIYRDLKPENVLLDRRGHVKLTDFGLSKESVTMTNTFCGTIEYMAPEILRRSGHGKEVDWWSLGTLLFDMLSGGPPFSQECGKEDTIEKILHCQIVFPKYFSPEVIRLIDGLLKRNPRDRLGSRNDVEDIKNHEFFRVHDICWRAVFERKLESPFLPELNSDSDVSCFDPSFTDQQPVLTPDDVAVPSQLHSAAINGQHNGQQQHPPTTAQQCSRAAVAPANVITAGDLFAGFSYVAPTVASSLLNDSFLSSSSHCRRLSRRSTLSGLSDSGSSTHSNSGINIQPLTCQSGQLPFLNESDFVDIAPTKNGTVANASCNGEQNPKTNGHSHHDNSSTISFSTSPHSITSSRSVPISFPSKPTSCPIPIPQKAIRKTLK